jgi:hypothetical protein
VAPMVYFGTFIFLDVSTLSFTLKRVSWPEFL